MPTEAFNEKASPLDIQRKILQLVAVFGLSLFLISCQEELPLPGPPQSAREWIEASSRHHDPRSIWQAFQGQVLLKSYLPGGTFGWQNQVWIDYQNDTFRREGSWKGSPVIQQIQGTRICHAEWSHPEANRNDSLRVGLGPDSCDAIQFYRDFYGFLLGMPMSVLSKDAEFRRFAFEGAEVWVEISFAEDEPEWTFAIDTATHQLLSATFRYPNGSGESIELSYGDWFRGMKLANSWTWTRVGGGHIITDSLEYRALKS